jgi:hypothetical protein
VAGANPPNSRLGRPDGRAGKTAAGNPIPILMSVLLM